MALCTSLGALIFGGGETVDAQAASEYPSKNKIADRSAPRFFRPRLVVSIF
jgi:hypothetical protein